MRGQLVTEEQKQKLIAAAVVCADRTHADVTEIGPDHNFTNREVRSLNEGTLSDISYLTTICIT